LAVTLIEIFFSGESSWEGTHFATKKKPASNHNMVRKQASWMNLSKGNKTGRY